MEQTLIMLKPDAFAKGLVGEVLLRLERARFKFAAMKIFRFDQSLAERFYGEHRGKSFFEPLIKFMTSGPTLAVVVEGENAIVRMRKLVGATDPANADPGTLRHDYASNGRENIIHASDSPANVEREKAILFP